MESEINEALKFLHDGKIILYPTDTIWGIGCDATNINAIKAIENLKGRTKDKSFLVLVSDENMLHRYVKNIPEVVWDIIDFSTKPLTIIYDEPNGLPKELLATDGSLGIRIVKDNFCEQLIRKLKKPIVSTSANLSGAISPKNFSQISEEIKKGVNHIVNLRQNDKETANASTIIRIKNNGEISILRP